MHAEPKGEEEGKIAGLAAHAGSAAAAPNLVLSPPPAARGLITFPVTAELTAWCPSTTKSMVKAAGIALTKDEAIVFRTLTHKWKCDKGPEEQAEQWPPPRTELES